ncbi:hypothetical protein [Lentilitoribacter sp. Alg239-R112]|uniref:tetratricopeptide repeat protein n=1 Tax=Lentilitoribacter sp. Alg239-R112 TaxID=2305987 RepID=UPI0013A6F65F|nr:hypothetical protein [Lentilitoribacter sp. Alg239-R112]
MESFTDDEIEAALERIFSSGVFKSSPKLRQFLRYIVTQKINGQDDQLKAYSIAIDVYKYPTDFDPQNDPIIRVQARRLRSALKEYYLQEGASEHLKISVPLGSYRPVFSKNLDLYEKKQLKLISQDKERFTKLKQRYILAGLLVCLMIIGLCIGWILGGAEGPNTDDHDPGTITVVIREENGNLSYGKDKEDVKFFSRNIQSSLVRNSALSIILPEELLSDKDANGADNEVDFIINIRGLQSDFVRYIAIELADGHTGRLHWTKAHRIFDVNDNTILQIVTELSSRILGASVQALDGRDPRTLTASQLFVLATWIPGPAKSTLTWEKERIDLARLALEKDPDFGPAYSVLADKLAYLAAVDGASDTKEFVDEARVSATRALELSAGDGNALFNVAQHYWHLGQLDDSIAMMKRVLEVDPSHGFARFFSIVLPYTCSMAPDKVLDEVVDFDQSLDSDNPARWVTLTWLGWLHLNREEYEAALKAEEQSAQIFQIPYTIMRRAAILNLLDRPEEAMDLLESQKSNWPNLDPTHFAKITFPRLCSERENSGKIIGFYEELQKLVNNYVDR